LLVVALFGAQARAGKLDEASKAARSRSSLHVTSSESSSDTSCTNCTNAVDELAGLALLYVVASPWLLPNVLVEAKRTDGAAGRVRFADYPYARGSEGLLIETRPVVPPPPPENFEKPDAPRPVVLPNPPLNVEHSASRKAVAVELGLEAGIGVDDAVVRSGFQARALFPFRLGLDTRWSLYREAQPGGVDQLGLGREHLNLRFAESSHVLFETGIGPQHLVDASGWVHGFDLTWGFQAFPGKPVVFAAEGSLGTLGGVFAPGARGELGVMLNRFKISAGFEQRWVGPVALGGPFVTLTAWL
jgi:hypothetical protein